MPGFFTLLREAWSGMLRNLRIGKWIILCSVLVTASVGWWMVHPMDDYWLALLQGGRPPDPTLRRVANFIGDSGDLLQFHLLVFAGLWIFGTIRKRPVWRRMAVASLLAMIVAGLACNVLRPSLGRPRPSARQKQELVDGLHPMRGFREESGYQSLPSAHTATAFGTAIPVLVACPPLGVPVTLYAGAMGWARMVQNQHHPSDVLGGALLGIIPGVALGVWVRRARGAKQSRRKERQDAP